MRISDWSSDVCSSDLKLWRERGFYRLLDRMLFRAARPDQRYRILQRFYALDERLIERFYAARSSGYDRLRILTGKPPVPVMAALKTLYGGRGRSEEHTSELQSLMRISYAVFCLKKKNNR